MRLVTYQYKQQLCLGEIQENKVYDIQRSYIEYCSALLKNAALVGSFSRMEAILAAGEEAIGVARDCIRFVQDKFTREEQGSRGLVHDQHEITLQAPISNPGKLIAVGGNFPAAGKLSPPDYPIIFLKPASTIIGPGGSILVSSFTASVSYEVELVVVIGRCAHRVAEAHALDYVAGYSLANDMGDRLLEKRTSQWTTGKMFDTFTPLGPVILTPDELPDTHDLSMETLVNGLQVQKGNSGDMFFDVSQLLSYISHLTTLQPGDLILTGSPKLIAGETPPAVSLKPGDTVRVSIAGLGELLNPVEAEPE
jgi:2-keto-4-pentenoate hydratase/2-oxohepta-3-ene-1,7-dioic acid hydratase in catechol pathway